MKLLDAGVILLIVMGGYWVFKDLTKEPEPIPEEMCPVTVYMENFSVQKEFPCSEVDHLFTK